MRQTFRASGLHRLWVLEILAVMLFAGLCTPVLSASTTCSANVAIPGTGPGNTQMFDVFQSGNCDNDALGLFAGANVPITNDAVGSSGPQTVTGSNGNTYTLEWSGPNPDTYTIILVSQVAPGPEILTFSYFFDDGSADPGNTTNAIFTINISLPSLGPTVPGAPTIGTATPGNAQASVSFTAPASNGGAAITSYTVTSSPGGITGTGSASPITVTGLTNGTAYSFTVAATNIVGTGASSSASNSVTPKTVPSAPTIGTATRGNAQASVTFTAPASNGGAAITSYTVTSSPGGITANGSSSPITVTGLTNGTAYTFTVAATNIAGTGAVSSASNSVTPATVPGAPSIGTATAGDSQVSVTFNAPIANGGSAITGYTATSSPGSITGSGAGSPVIVSGLINGVTYTFTVTATNAVGTGPASLSSGPVTPIAPPIAAGSSTTVAYDSNSNAIPLSLSGGAATSVSVTTAAAHGALTVSGNSISYTPTTGFFGSDAFSYTATNSSGTSAPATVSLVVSAPAITVSPSTLPAASIGVAYSQSLTASGGQAPYVFSTTLASGSLPAGLSLAANGTITGTPTAAGLFSFTVRGTDSSTTTPANFSAAKSLTVSSPTITLSPVTLPPFSVGSGTPYNQTITASGGTTPYFFAVTAGSLPPGLSLSNSGVVSGTGVVGGQYFFTVTATDSSSGTGPFTGSRAYDLAATLVPPGVLNDRASTNANQAATIPVTSNDTGQIDSITVSAGPTHGQATVNGLDVIYAPERNYAGPASFQYTATGPGGTSSAATVSVTVLPLSGPSGSGQSISISSAIPSSLHVTANATGGPFTAITIVSPPSSGIAVVRGLDIVYLPAANLASPQVVTFTYTITNSFGVSAPITVTVTVSPSTQPISQVKPPHLWHRLMRQIQFGGAA